MALPGHAPAEPFFLEAGTGTRVCLFHRPVGDCRAGLVYLHPFAEEMNRSRRMAALTARALAAHGVAVLQIDLHGCGDSSGEFAQARWDTWKQDVGCASDWLRSRIGCDVGVWGLRLGALLALDYAHTAPQPVDRLLLWQPVTSGAGFLTQFLRLRVAGDMLQDEGAKGGTQALRAALQAGSSVEIAGYELAPTLANAIDIVEAAPLAPNCPVHWFEVVAASDRPAPPSAARIASAWRELGVDVRLEVATGEPFWITQEITECRQLVEATVSVYREAAHA
jgi:exosortase A-associated hydrolase 2